MGAFLLMLPFLMPSSFFIILTSVIFALFCLFGCLLIRSAIKEGNYKDILEKEVASRTDELKIAKNVAETRAGEAEKAKNLAEQRMQEINERKEDLERFYKLTVGRELKMVELKKKVSELKKD